MTSIICMSISHKPLLNAVSSLYLICYTLNIKYIMFTHPLNLILVNKKFNIMAPP